MGKWELLAFNDAINDETKLATKIKKEDYLSQGEYQIVDQGKNDVAGYTNDSTGLYKDVPTIIFGDHTRILKYVDKPLFIGADGVKLLKAKREDLYPKFVFYFLRSCNVIDTGYNRHFKWLKEFRIPLPPRQIQQQIADVLDRASTLIEKRKAQIDKLDLLVKSQFIEMFGDPVMNPKGWEKVSLGKLGTLKNGMNFNRADNGYDILCLGVGDFKNLSVIDNMEQLSAISLNEKPSAEYLLSSEDIVFVRSNGNRQLIGRSIVIYTGGIDVTFSGFCIRFRRTCEKVNITYLNTLLHNKTFKSSLLSNGRGANIQNLNQQMLSSQEIILPPILIQVQFADFVHQVEAQKQQLQVSLAKMELQYKSLMQKCFRGELF